MSYLLITQEELEGVFKLWNDDFIANPDNYVSVSEFSAADQAKNFIEFLGIVRGGETEFCQDLELACLQEQYDKLKQEFERVAKRAAELEKQQAQTSH